MRRIRRSAEAVLAKRDYILPFATACCAHSQAAPSKDGCRKDRNHAQKQGNSPSTDLLAFVLFQLFEHLQSRSLLSLLSGLWLIVGCCSGEVLNA